MMFLVIFSLFFSKEKKTKKNEIVFGVFLYKKKERGTFYVVFGVSVFSGVFYKIKNTRKNTNTKNISKMSQH